MRLGHVPATGQPRAARRHRAGRHRQQGPLRPGPHPGRARTAGACRRRPRSRATSSWRPPPTCGRSPPESATRVGHPAPFPVELPQRLIELYTYVGDVVLDPVHGLGLRPRWPRCAPAGTTSASTPTPTTSPSPSERIADERERDPAATGAVLPPVPSSDTGADAARRGGADGRTARDVAAVVLRALRLRDHPDRRTSPRGLGVVVSFVARDRTGRRLGVRRVGGVHRHRGGPAARRHAVEGAGQGGGAPRTAARAFRSCCSRPISRRGARTGTAPSTPCTALTARSPMSSSCSTPATTTGCVVMPPRAALTPGDYDAQAVV